MKDSFVSYLTHLECSVCSTAHDHTRPQTVCTACGRSLLARYDLVRAKKELGTKNLSGRGATMWRYREMLPVSRQEHIISLGEGFTPILPLTKFGSRLGLRHLMVKEEGLNPTGSFKARGLCMAVSKAREAGVQELCVPTAGNAGGALAAYAAAAGLPAHIFMPDDTPEVNILECRSYGADVRLVPGLISDAAAAMNREKDPAWFDVSTLKEPYRVEGKKTLGYEVAEQMNWDLPDVIVYPTGGGTGMIGMWKAFDEMEQLGWIGSKRPRMVAVQSAGCAPIVRAFDAGESSSQFWENASTLASGLRVPKAFADYLVLGAVSASGGCALAVTDEQIVSTISQVASADGLLLCPEGAATVAAVNQMLELKMVEQSERILLFNTGSGLKYIEVLRHLNGR